MDAIVIRESEAERNEREKLLARALRVQAHPPRFVRRPSSRIKISGPAWENVVRAYEERN